MPRNRYPGERGHSIICCMKCGSITSNTSGVGTVGQGSRRNGHVTTAQDENFGNEDGQECHSAVQVQLNFVQNWDVISAVTEVLCKTGINRLNLFAMRIKLTFVR